MSADLLIRVSKQNEEDLKKNGGIIAGADILTEHALDGTTWVKCMLGWLWVMGVYIKMEAMKGVHRQFHSNARKNRAVSKLSCI